MLETPRCACGHPISVLLGHESNPQSTLHPDAAVPCQQQSETAALSPVWIQPGCHVSG